MDFPVVAEPKVVEAESEVPQTKTAIRDALIAASMQKRHEVADAVSAAAVALRRAEERRERELDAARARHDREMTRVGEKRDKEVAEAKAKFNKAKRRAKQTLDAAEQKADKPVEDAGQVLQKARAEALQYFSNQELETLGITAYRAKPKKKGDGDV